MIVTADRTEETKASKAEIAAQDSRAGPSHEILDDPPPAFEDIAEDGHLLADYPAQPRPEDAPPEFSHYSADYFTVGGGDVVSHDPHLNTDGEALYRFLLEHANTRPQFMLNCKGTHQERRTRQVSQTVNGQTTTKIEHYSETVTDFDFCIDILYVMDQRLTHFTISDNEPAYRGKSYKEIMTFKGLRKAQRKECRETKKWAEERRDRGLPPWVPLASNSEWDHAMVNVVGDGVYSSTKTVREWADEYCRSPKLLKEFVYEKVVYGWNLQDLEYQIKDAIMKNTFYQGELLVEFKTHAAAIYVRPDNRLSRALSNTWIQVLLWITLIYPFVWLFKRLHRLGGGKYAVVGGAYALKRWVPTEPSQNTISAPDGTSRRLEGFDENDWFRHWQPTILKAVERRYQSFTPIYQPSVSADGSNVIPPPLVGI